MDDWMIQQVMTDYISFGKSKWKCVPSIQPE